jgi:hypothetical protein
MKRLPITFEERQFFKAIEKTAVVLLIMFRIYPTPVNIESLSYEMKWDARTAEKYLESLASDNLTILVKGQGYVLTGETRRLIAQFFGTILTMPLEAPALAQGSQVQALNSQVLDNGVKLETQLHPFRESVYSGPENRTENEILPGADLTHTVCVPLEEEESLSLKNLNKSSSNLSESAQNVQNAGHDIPGQVLPERSNLPTVERILGATPILFGDPGVITRGLHLDDITPLMALSWIAHAWDQWPRGGHHGDLRSPAGLVYKNLADPTKPQPRSKYCDGGWKQVLPDKFLEVLGLAEYSCQECDKQFSTQKDIDMHIATDHPVPEIDPTVEISSPGSGPDLIIPNAKNVRRFDGSMSAGQAWVMVQSQLQVEMTRSGYETWVRDTQGVSYENGELTVMTANPYGRAWLESRLTSTVERMLVGILNAEVTVKFVELLLNGDLNE